MSRAVAGSPGSREWAEIKRWDPRLHMTQAQQQKVGVFSRGPYGGVIKFDPTMRQRAAGGGATLGHWVQHGKDQGWVPLSTDKKVSGHWAWNDVWGKQSSVLDLEVGTEFVKYSSRRNCIDLMGIRLLVSQVLQRCMMNMSNRQAVLVADSIFNRAGVVPGIYQAILAQGTDYRMEKIGLSDIMARFEERKKPYVDVTREMVFEHERQIACNGDLALQLQL
ncbi:unnamed protein product [Cladocopium goreaui]|uniref:C2 domain-containing protein n=1 Tax=Cladocopium goreaui TaxID=2562237 RepID=A0A9P1DKA5_9DINO|nr:unnamed protein product [Cladocopium goreaui]